MTKKLAKTARAATTRSPKAARKPTGPYGAEIAALLEAVDCRQADIDNVLAAVDEWAPYCVEHPSVDLNSMIETLLAPIDWNTVPTSAIKAALRTILIAAPPSEAAAVSRKADGEREVLAQCKVSDDAYQTGDKLGFLAESNHEAYKVIAGLVDAAVEAVRASMKAAG